MKFAIIKLILWLNNGKKREINFKPDKVNVITGDSNTGKTAILQIFDYCFFGSKSKLSESIINENVAWYGLLIKINNKDYTIARKSLTNNKVSQNYYFSSTGELPNTLESNVAESSLKSLFETEFKIDRSVTVAYGSNSIKAGTKISLRYFLMFNTISGNIIDKDTNIFFDKQDVKRYREALPRIFDLAIGIETVENILKKEKKANLEKELTKLQKKETVYSKKRDEFEKDKIELVRQAKEYSLIDSSLDLNEGIAELLNIAKEFKSTKKNPSNRDKLQREIYLIQRKIKNLTQFTTEYINYKKSLKGISDSLKPIEFLKTKDQEIIKTSIFNDVYEILQDDLKKIKAAHKGKTPIDNQVNDSINELRAQLKSTQDKLALFPKENKNFKNELDKSFFLGQVKAKLDLFLDKEKSSAKDLTKQIEKVKKSISLLEIDNTDEKRILSNKMIEEIILEYIKYTNDVLENYSNYLPVFSYKEKALFLRKPKTSYIENIGSSSNHLFLHLFFSLGMHEVVFQHKSPYIAPLLIIDQPSRPYWGGEDKKRKKLKESDIYKITKAFDLLNYFLDQRIKNDGYFQMIVLEHISPDIFNEMEHVHLVEIFQDGNALIPSSMI